MCIASAKALAKFAEDKGLTENYIIPGMDEWEIYPMQATEVAMKCIEQGLARKKASRAEIHDGAAAIIERTQKIVKLLMAQGFIPAPPPEPK
jgi:malate dehydrogenase (oxaloacetate-decarboxylating)